MLLPKNVSFFTDSFLVKYLHAVFLNSFWNELGLKKMCYHFVDFNSYNLKGDIMDMQK